jgi:hypothetical protein
LQDPHQLLTGTGNLIRHIAVKTPADYQHANVKALVEEAIRFALKDIDKPGRASGETIFKIKR